jgi:hypothetical protein
MLRYGCGFGRRTPALSHAQAGLDLCDLIEAALEAGGVVGSSGMTTRRRMLNKGGGRSKLERRIHCVDGIDDVAVSGTNVSTPAARLVTFV